MKNNKNKTWKQIFQYVSHYKIRLCLSLICALVTVVLTLYVPILTGRAIDCIIGAGKVDFAEMGKIILQILICVAVTSLAQWGMSICNNHITYHVVNDIRREAFEKIEHLPLSFIDRHATGEIVSKLITDVAQFADGLLMGFTQLFTGVLTIIGTLGFMMFLNPKIALVVVCVTPLSLLVAKFISGRTYHLFLKQSELRAEQTGFIDEMVGNLKTVKAYQHESENMEHFRNINERLEKASLDATFYSSITNPATRFVNNVVYAGVGLTGALSVLSGSLSVGQLSSFLNYANQYTKPFNEISGVLTELQNALACAERVFGLTEEAEELPDAKDAKVLEKCSGKIELNRVSFSYVPHKKLIENLNLSVDPGQHIAIVGPTGCGKTTLINLLMRFYDVNEGAVCVDDIDLRNCTRHSLRRNYGMVLQETWLKAGSIKENISFGKPEATMAEVVEAAKKAHADGFIRRLPEGYDTVIGEDGGMLSQGQKQLLCIARIMLCHPPMLILDEATSSIDTRTELKIQDAFGKLMKGRTSFIVAHRLSTIKEADRILVMKDGNIIEQGNHQELLKQNGFYAALYQSQFAI